MVDLATMRDGVDANSDGTVAAAKGEGGMAQLHRHVGYMAKGEGL